MLQVVGLLLQGLRLYQGLIVVAALMTWLPGASSSALGQVIRRFTQPYLSLFDRLIPSMGGLSFSAVAGVFVLELAQRGLITLAMGLGVR